MHLSIKLSHVILMNMKFKSQPSRGKKKKKEGKKVERERVHLVGGESEVKRKQKSLHREEKFCCFFYLFLVTQSITLTLLLSAQRKVLSGLQNSDQILRPL